MVSETDPEWQSQVEEVWLWDEYSERWVRDGGIDLVFTHKNGKTWEVQSKCYSLMSVLSIHRKIWQDLLKLYSSILSIR